MLWFIFITIRNVLLLLTTIFVLFLIILKTSKRVQDRWFAFLLEKILKINIEKNIAAEKQKLFTELKLVKSKDPQRLNEGKVKILEIGAGSGSNFKYYPENTSLICVEPNNNFQKYFQENQSKFPNVKLDLFICSGAEDMKEIEDDSVDVVVSTHVLCSVNDVQKVLQEVKRVLMKGSRFYYYDHQISPEMNFTVIFSKIIEPVWKILGGNCHLTRDIGKEVERAGFEEVSQYYKYIDKFPFIVRYHYSLKMLWFIFITIRNVLLLLTTIFVLFLIILKTSKRVQDRWFAFLLEKILKINIEKNIAAEKQKLFTELKLVKSKDPQRLNEGKVKILEIGAGSGSNFKYYPENTSLICVEPNNNFQKYFQENQSKFPNVKLDLFICSGAEDMKEIEDDSVDVVVSTHVLCSVNDVQKVLQEVKRVLMKGSRFYYYDHQISPEMNFTVIFSKIIEPVWKILGGNCHLTRDIGKEVERAGFEEVSQYYKYIDKFPFIVRYHVLGYATK
ncbi:uncharacterized protein LOC111621287 [Centruroides sculpturatus]|uniref:uncharacterized protein LOC111621287 n=1 Tax=Centruroides sculpturatus TaxID=218467 RepID=UPI000C6DDE92|nr:uncharacterized protein LOC111621287 [Centruroides sculpturatus]